MNNLRKKLDLSTRKQALAILEKGGQRGAFPSALLSAAARRAGINYSLLQALVKGVIQNIPELDRQVDRIAAATGARVGRRARNILRLALYQLFFFS